MTHEEFTKMYCTMCGSQRCGGPYTDWIDGCAHRDALDITRTTSVTNADRIRAMSDKELAEKLSVYDYCPGEKAWERSCKMPYDCIKCWLDWLQSPVEGDGNG